VSLFLSHHSLFTSSVSLLNNLLSSILMDKLIS